MATHSKKQEAILIIGPTGSGKTPLGNFMEKKGYQGKKCHHFDFGENLRLIAKKGLPAQLFDQSDICFIREVLSSGALLKDKDFPVALKIIKSFIKRKRLKPNDFIILNGLPRHISQAKDMAKLVDVKMLIHLVSSPETILERIRTNAGGDRKGRVDDDIESVTKKLKIFNKDTAPLIGYYRRQGIKIANINIDVNTMPEDILDTLKRQ